MKICILSGNPKKDGLCQSIINEVKQGVVDGGAEVDEIRLCDLNLTNCKVCGNGWGTCVSEHHCQFGSDGFNDIMERIKTCDALVLATPVYWGETSEALKCFIDRLRRCDFNQNGVMRNKQVLLVASAGGSGGGLLICLSQMERFCHHTGAIVFDYISCNRWNSDYKKVAAKLAAAALAKGRKNGETV